MKAFCFLISLTLDSTFDATWNIKRLVFTSAVLQQDDCWVHTAGAGIWRGHFGWWGNSTRLIKAGCELRLTLTYRRVHLRRTHKSTDSGVTYWLWNTDHFEFLRNLHGICIHLTSLSSKWLLQRFLCDAAEDSDKYNNTALFLVSSNYCVSLVLKRPSKPG